MKLSEIFEEADRPAKKIEHRRLDCARPPIVISMRGQYGKDPDIEQRRAKFYYWCAQVFEFENWHRPRREEEQNLSIGCDGRGNSREKYGHTALASFRNNKSHPLEYFEGSQSLLSDRMPQGWRSKPVPMSSDAHNRRVRLARVYYDLKMGAQVTPLASVDFGGTGGGGFGPRSPNDHAIDCMKFLKYIHMGLPKVTRRIMEDVFYHGLFIFDVPNKKKKHSILEHLRLGLDVVAIEMRELNYKDFRARWPEMAVHDEWRKRAMNMPGSSNAHRSPSHAEPAPQ